MMFFQLIKLQQMFLPIEYHFRSKVIKNHTHEKHSTNRKNDLKDFVKTF